MARFLKKADLNENLSRLYEDLNERPSVFLSHSYTDKETVEELEGFFTLYGFDVYVDWRDPLLSGRVQPDGDTARRIASKMKECEACLVLVSDNIYPSNWVPWEVGLGCGILGVKGVILLPFAIASHMLKEASIVENHSKGWEFMQMYPYIKYDPPSRALLVVVGKRETDLYEYVKSL